MNINTIILSSSTFTYVGFSQDANVPTSNYPAILSIFPHQVNECYIQMLLKTFSSFSNTHTLQSRQPSYAMPNHKNYKCIYALSRIPSRIILNSMILSLLLYNGATVTGPQVLFVPSPSGGSYPLSLSLMYSF